MKKKGTTKNEIIWPIKRVKHKVTFELAETMFPPNSESIQKI